ncbi:hypothetical protein ACFOVU_03205 [Nocardiopsis sediminis]|uniref:Deoxyxylulose-5-phosphate synthase n=1 Tax=Nocardiopsis sediminis TaxID=1778267 RepID=A0ABV8FJU2_9ACTN
MCRYAISYKCHFVCLTCRVAFKQAEHGASGHRCPQCRTPMIDAGPDLAVPPRRDTRAWRALEATLRAGITFHSCGCGGPGYRPKSWPEVRERREAARRMGMTECTALRRPEPWEVAGREGGRP